jgi:DNA-directed RNA polymerase alpha subunit
MQNLIRPPRTVFTRKPHIDMRSTAPDLLRVSGLRAYLSNRTISRLQKVGIETLGQTVEFGVDRLFTLHGFSQKSRNEVVSCLRTHGISGVPNATKNPV